jgi:mannitol/fructose-specific phosphotransferase system IIA component (Ntr-type)
VLCYAVFTEPLLQLGLTRPPCPDCPFHRVNKRPPPPIDIEVHLDVAVTDTTSLFRFVDSLVTNGQRIGKGWVEQSLSRRQSRASTALGRGVALPHASVRNLRRPKLLYTRLQEPIAMDAPDGEPVLEAMTLLVRYPASSIDHVLLDRLRDPHMNTRILELFRQGRSAEVVAHLLTQP